jgi:hypothetical protein
MMVRVHDSPKYANWNASPHRPSPDLSESVGIRTRLSTLHWARYQLWMLRTRDWLSLALHLLTWDRSEYRDRALLVYADFNIASLKVIDVSYEFRWSRSNCNSCQAHRWSVKIPGRSSDFHNSLRCKGFFSNDKRDSNPKVCCKYTIKPNEATMVNPTDEYLDREPLHIALVMRYMLTFHSE